MPTLLLRQCHSAQEIAENSNFQRVLILLAILIMLTGCGVIVGHDFGATIAWHSALLRVDVFRALALLSVPLSQRPWNARRPTEAFKRMVGNKQQFYQQHFEEPGKAEAELRADVRKTLLMVLYIDVG
jgi:pimeloyl-ACP methyl ester carboxylesterase